MSIGQKPYTDSKDVGGGEEEEEEESLIFSFFSFGSERVKGSRLAFILYCLSVRTSKKK
jgi:hypothetical protein